MCKKSLLRFLLIACTVSAAAVFSFACSEEEKTSPVTGTMLIESEPDGVSISCLGKDLGITPKVTKPIPAGTYVLKLTKPGYKPVWYGAEVKAGEETSVKCRLEKASSSAMIVSDPPGAVVTMAGRKIGTTPVSLPDLPFGKYSVTLSMKGYSSRTVDWTVENERPVAVEVTLSSNVGRLIVNSDPTDAYVFIDGVQCGSTPYNDLLENGEHKIRLEKKGFVPFEKVVTIDTKGRTLTASEMKMALEPSSVTVLTEPAGATVFLDGKDIGASPVKIVSNKQGTRKIRVTMEGFDPAEREIAVSPGNDYEVKLKLDRNTGGVDMVINPPGVTVYLDKKLVGVTVPDKNNPKISQVFQLHNLSAGEHEITIAHKRGKPAVRTAKFNILKGRVLRADPVTMWVADAEVWLKDGRKYIVRLIGNDVNDDSTDVIRYEPEPGVGLSFKKSDVAKVSLLHVGE